MIYILYPTWKAYTYIYSEQDGCLRLFNHFQKIICWWRRNWCNLSDQKSRQDNNKIKNPLSFSNNWQQQTQNWYRNNNEKQKKFSKFSFWSIFLTLYCLHICLSGIRCVFMPIGIGFRSGIRPGPWKGKWYFCVLFTNQRSHSRRMSIQLQLRVCCRHFSSECKSTFFRKLADNANWNS